MKNLHPILLYRELAWNVRHGEPLRLLSLQIGATHVGVAISDVPPKGSVSLHCVSEREKGSIMATKFRKLIKEQSVGGIVVGVPSSIQEKNPRKNLQWAVCWIHYLCTQK
nr:hypothetical protein [Tanacetum cinerariifolium]